MQEINKEDRLNQIKKLDNFLESSNSIINDLLLKFNFTRKEVFEVSLFFYFVEVN